MTTPEGENMGEWLSLGLTGDINMPVEAAAEQRRRELERVRFSQVQQAKVSRSSSLVVPVPQQGDSNPAPAVPKQPVGQTAAQRIQILSPEAAKQVLAVGGVCVVVLCIVYFVWDKPKDKPSNKKDNKKHRKETGKKA